MDAGEGPEPLHGVPRPVVHGGGEGPPARRLADLEGEGVDAAAKRHGDGVLPGAAAAEDVAVVDELPVPPGADGIVAAEEEAGGPLPGGAELRRDDDGPPPGAGEEGREIRDAAGAEAAGVEEGPLRPPSPAGGVPGHGGEVDLGLEGGVVERLRPAGEGAGAPPGRDPGEAEVHLEEARRAGHGADGEGDGVLADGEVGDDLLRPGDAEIDGGLAVPLGGADDEGGAEGPVGLAEAVEGDGDEEVAGVVVGPGEDGGVVHEDAEPEVPGLRGIGGGGDGGGGDGGGEEEERGQRGGGEVHGVPWVRRR